MAKDRWGSLVLAGALSHVDDTVLLRKCILPELQVSLFNTCALHLNAEPEATCENNFRVEIGAEHTLLASGRLRLLYV